MIGRSVLLVATVVGAVAVPYFLSSADRRAQVSKWWSSFRGGPTAESALVDPALLKLLESQAHWSPQDSEPPRPVIAEPGKPSETAPHPEGPTIQYLWQVFRFDVTPSWVMSNWERVTSRLIQRLLEGYRVALVTGTEANDLVGSLTYYFDKQGQLQRISFHGNTGNPSELVALVTGQFGLRAEPALGAGLYMTKWNGEPTSVLRLQTALAAQSRDPTHRLQVYLELNRPGSPQGLSSEFRSYANVNQKEKRRGFGLFRRRRSEPSPRESG